MAWWIVWLSHPNRATVLQLINTLIAVLKWEYKKNFSRCDYICNFYFINDSGMQTLIFTQYYVTILFGKLLKESKVLGKCQEIHLSSFIRYCCEAIMVLVMLSLIFFSFCSTCSTYKYLMCTCNIVFNRKLKILISFRLFRLVTTPFN